MENLGGYISAVVIEQNCPLCNNNAKYEFKCNGNLKHFLCSTCCEFLISIDAEKRLSEGIPQQRTALSEKAKLSNKEKVFEITLASTESKQDGIAYPVFNEEFVERKKLVG